MRTAFTFYQSRELSNLVTFLGNYAQPWNLVLLPKDNGGRNHA